MAKQTINPGTAPTGAGGDTFRSGSAKLQANDDELYDFIGGAANTTTLPSALPLKKGGTGASTAAAARTNLGLGTAATQNKSRAFLGAGAAAPLGGNKYINPSEDGQYVVGFSSSEPTHPPINGTGYFFPINDAEGITNTRFRFAILNSGSSSIWYQVTGNAGVSWSSWSKVYTSRNTSVDSNGFIKSASPIVQLFADKIELNDEAQQQNIEFEKLGVGDYVIKGSSGFAQEGWYIETPKDANGNLLVAVVYEQLENGDISVKTYDYMLNKKGRIVADIEAPLDIPENRWIDLRLQELPQPEIEMPESIVPPEFQPTGLAQAVATVMESYDDPEQ